LGRPSKYTQEFRRDAVALVRSSGRPVNQVARELGMSHETLRNWVRADDRARAECRESGRDRTMRGLKDKVAVVAGAAPGNIGGATESVSPRRGCWSLRRI
jgi:transposase